MKKIETFLMGDTLETIFDFPWYEDFCKDWEHEDFFAMHAAANHMNITSLSIRVCIALDTLDLKENTVTEIGQVFKLAVAETDRAS